MPWEGFRLRQADTLFMIAGGVFNNADRMPAQGARTVSGSLQDDGTVIAGKLEYDDQATQEGSPIQRGTYCRTRYVRHWGWLQKKVNRAMASAI